MRHNLPTLPLASEKKSFSKHIKGVKEGDHSELNTWQWRHAPFFNRVKNSVGRVWAPNTQISRHDPKGLLLGQKDRTTVMLVSIDTNGQLKSLKIAESSGVAYLDEEAERSFKAAAPFSYPPRDLFEQNQYFTFHFAFHVEVKRGLSVDMNWGSSQFN
ncbi:MAG: energy transducer TonB [Myxococcales bacterium]|nr:energy transducer TonB [Myxococcales bacterium]